MIRSAPRVAPLLVTTALIAAQSLSAQAPPPPAPAHAAADASDLPSPPGDSGLGTFSEVWGDESRPGGVDRGAAGPREIRIQVWYPAAREASGPPAPYVPELEDLAPVFGEERAARYRSVRTHSLWRAEPDRDRGPYPVVVFSHGKGMVRSFYTALLERLAAGGRVVVAIDHPLGAEAVLLSGGRVVQLDPRWEEMEPPAVPIEEVFRFTEERSSLWVEDVRFVIDRLSELARPGTDWLLAGTLDLDRLAAIGHSLGGKAAALGCKRDRRIRACADLDGWPLHRSVEAEGLNQPFLLLEDYRDVSAEELAAWGAERSEYVENMRALQRRKDDLFSRMPAESAHVMIRGIRHGSFTDAPFLRPDQRDPAATLPPERALETIADYLGAFLAEHLEGRETELFHPGAYVRIYGPRYEPSDPVSPRRSSSAADDTPPRIFRFTTDGFWLNLHHFLYVLGRVEAGMPDVERRAVAQAPGDQERGLAEVSLEERALWREAVAIYAEGPSQLDMVFDEKLLKTTHRLKDAESLDTIEIDSKWKEALEKAAPLYRRVWWPEHRAANAAWVEATEPFLDEHGGAVLDFLLRAYGETWPEEGYPVQLSGYANWAGAYSTYGRLLVMSSLDDAMRGNLAGVEIVFHEAAHQFDSAVVDELVAAARAEGIRFGRSLDHALLFFTVGEAVRQAASEHVPYAHAHGVWDREMGRFLPALEAGWQPYLASEELGDEAARRAALRAVMRALGETSEPAPPPSGDP